jgi:hypothetical protein
LARDASVPFTVFIAQVSYFRVTGGYYAVDDVLSNLCITRQERWVTR